MISFDIQTLADSDDTEPPETFYVNVSPVRTAIVNTPRLEITICGGSYKQLFSENNVQAFLLCCCCCCLVILGCPNLTNPVNGVVMQTGTAVGDTATYTCSSGYILDGASTRTCGSDGQWTADVPRCLGK